MNTTTKTNIWMVRCDDCGRDICTTSCEVTATSMAFVNTATMNTDEVKPINRPMSKDGSCLLTNPFKHQRKECIMNTTTKTNTCPQEHMGYRLHKAHALRGGDGVRPGWVWFGHQRRRGGGVLGESQILEDGGHSFFWGAYGKDSAEAAYAMRTTRSWYA